jgi:hypothetical protein
MLTVPYRPSPPHDLLATKCRQSAVSGCWPVWPRQSAESKSLGMSSLSGDAFVVVLAWAGAIAFLHILQVYDDEPDALSDRRPRHTGITKPAGRLTPIKRPCPFELVSRHSATPRRELGGAARVEPPPLVGSLPPGATDICYSGSAKP